MTSDGVESDRLFAVVASLKTHDVHKQRADALRRRCHALLEKRARRNASARVVARVSFRRAVGPAIAVGWCVAYLVEIIHRAASVYRF